MHVIITQKLKIYIQDFIGPYFKKNNNTVNITNISTAMYREYFL